MNFVVQQHGVIIYNPTIVGTYTITIIINHVYSLSGFVLTSEILCIDSHNCGFNCSNDEYSISIGDDECVCIGGFTWNTTEMSCVIDCSSINYA